MAYIIYWRHLGDKRKSILAPGGEFKSRLSVWPWAGQFPSLGLSSDVRITFVPIWCSNVSFIGCCLRYVDAIHRAYFITKKFLKYTLETYVNADFCTVTLGDSFPFYEPEGLLFYKMEVIISNMNYVTLPCWSGSCKMVFWSREWAVKLKYLGWNLHFPLTSQKPLRNLLNLS